MKHPNHVRLTVVPLTKAAANRFVVALHRHHGPSPFGLIYFCVGVVAEEKLVGVAIAGRPPNRNSDDGQTAEVLRVATDGTPNACSALYGACRQIAQRMGFSRIITYTLDTEPGVSLRAAGWVNEAKGIVSKWGKYKRESGSYGQVDGRDHWDVKKQRWAVHFRIPVIYTGTCESDKIV